MVCFIFLIICNKYCELKKIHVYFLSLHCILPFFINDFFMEYNYMPDQSRYIFYTDYFRFITDQKAINYDLSFNDDFFWSKTGFSAWILSYIPIPETMSLRSGGFANKVLFIILFSYLYKKKILTKFSAYFFLVYPSFALYSGIALKEMLSVFFMLLIIERSFNYNYKQIPILILFSISLYLIKYQFLIFVAPFSIILILNLFNFREKGYNGFVYALLSIISFVVGTFLFTKYGDLINNTRHSFFVDNGNNPEDFVWLTNFYDFLIFGIKETLKSLIEPLPSMSNNIYNNLQFLENIVITLTVITLTYSSLKSNYRKSLIWIFFILFSLTITAMVVDNIGTLSRYKFPLILAYVIYISYSITHGQKKTN